MPQETPSLASKQIHFKAIKETIICSIFDSLHKQPKRRLILIKAQHYSSKSTTFEGTSSDPKNSKYELINSFFSPHKNNKLVAPWSFEINEVSTSYNGLHSISIDLLINITHPSQDAIDKEILYKEPKIQIIAMETWEHRNWMSSLVKKETFFFSIEDYYIEHQGTAILDIDVTLEFKKPKGQRKSEDYYEFQQIIQYIRGADHSCA